MLPVLPCAQLIVGSIILYENIPFMSSCSNVWYCCFLTIVLVFINLIDNLIESYDTEFVNPFIFILLPFFWIMYINWTITDECRSMYQLQAPYLWLLFMFYFWYNIVIPTIVIMFFVAIVIYPGLSQR